MVFSLLISLLRRHSSVRLLLFGLSYKSIIKRHAGEGRHPVLLTTKKNLDTGLRRYDGNLLLLTVALLCISPILSAQPITVTDDLGNTISIPKPAERIIALSPHSVEQLFSLGVGDKIIGTVQYADYPEQAKQIKRIGDAMTINFEEVFALKPDLVVAWGKGTSQASIEKLKRLNIPVFLSGSSTLKDISTSLRRLGKLTGREAKATDLINELESKLQQYSNAANSISKKKLKVFVQVWGSPLRTIGGGHMVDELIQTCGGQNIYVDQQQASPVVSIESLLQRDPEMIVLNNKKGGFSGRLSELIKPWMNIKAVKRNNICKVDFDTLLRPTMRVLKAVDVLCGCIAKDSLNP